MAKTTVAGAVVLLLLGASLASAGSVLQDWAFSIGGQFVTAGSGKTIETAVTDLSTSGIGSGLTATSFAGSAFDLTGSSPASGLGYISIDVSLQADAVGPETVTVVAWLKYSFSDNNDGFYGDYGTAMGTAPSSGSGFLLDYATVTGLDDPLAYLASLQSGPSYFDPLVATAGPYDPSGGTPCCDVLLGYAITLTINPGATQDYLFQVEYSDASGGYHPQSNQFYVMQRGPTDGSGNALTGPGAETLYLTNAPEPDGWVLGLTGSLLIGLVRVSRKFRQRAKCDASPPPEL
jgi:hypothetical protein